MMLRSSLTPLCVFGLSLLAQGAADLLPTTKDGIAELIGGVTATGILIWYLWYNTAKAQPRLIDKFTKEAAAEREARNELADKFGAQLESERQLREQDNQRLVACLDKMHVLMDRCERANPKPGGNAA